MRNAAGRDMPCSDLNSCGISLQHQIPSRDLKTNPSELSVAACKHLKSKYTQSIAALSAEYMEHMSGIANVCYQPRRTNSVCRVLLEVLL